MPGVYAKREVAMTAFPYRWVDRPRRICDHIFLHPQLRRIDMDKTTVSTADVSDVAIRDVDSMLPSMSEFIEMIEDEQRQKKADPSAYSVYHKYNKGC